MSEVEQLWEAVRKKWPTPLKPWASINQQSQMMVIQAINLMIHVCQVEQK